MVNFDYFWPSFEYETQGSNSWFFTNFQIGTSRFLLKTRSKVVKIDKKSNILKIEKKCSFLTPDHFRSPRTRSSSSNQSLTIFRFFNFSIAKNSAFFQSELKSSLNLKWLHIKHGKRVSRSSSDSKLLIQSSQEYIY